MTNGSTPEPPRGGAPVNSPLLDWIPLYAAPFFSFNDGIHTPRTWAAACEEMAREIASRLDDSEKCEITRDERSVAVVRLGITTRIVPSGIACLWGQSLRIVGFGPGMLEDNGWKESASSEMKPAAIWHWQFIELFLYELHFNFGNHVSSGAAHLFARVDSPFAPFARIFPDQWASMKLEPHEEGVWGDAKPPSDRDRAPSARGPNGERIYSIYVAQGTQRFDKRDALEKCRHELRTLLSNNPKRQPMPKPQIIEQHAHEFNLSKRTVQSLLSEVADELGIVAWSKAGRLKESGQKSPRKK